MGREDLALFDETWKRLAHIGVCDAIGGAEYERVRGEWLSAGNQEASPADVEAFIRVRANVGPYAS